MYLHAILVNNGKQIYYFAMIGWSINSYLDNQWYRFRLCNSYKIGFHTWLLYVLDSLLIFQPMSDEIDRTVIALFAL